jgi:hypothetical protein
MAAPQPIACTAADPLDQMLASSYFLGSPLSWRTGSFGSRFYPGCSPGQLLGPLE